LAFGSTIIEKHFTLDKTLPGPDHAFALNPEELSIMIRSIRNASQTIGSGKKEILDVEEELRRFATRSIQATKKITKGDILKEGENIEILRPGKQSRGMEARFILEISGKRSKSDYEIGEGILE
jgi:N-acetylneuraminate synthase